MANLPQNQEYREGSGAGSFIGGLGTASARRGIPTSGRREAVNPGRFSNLAGLLEQAPMVPQGQAVVTSRPGISQLPQDYSGFVSERTPQGFTWPAPRADTTFLRTSPQRIIPGQRVIDTSQPGKIVKSARGIGSQERSLLLSGRPSNLYEVDHIIPLWAGGADTMTNMQVLPRPQHDRKTKAEAVAYTLLANGRINENQARYYALSWRDRDLSNIPSLNEYGLLPVDMAQSIKEQWDIDQQAPVKAFDWRKPGQSIKNLLAAVPDGARDLGPNLKATLGIEGQILPSHPVTDTIAGSVEEFAKGFSSGLTAGWIPYQPNADDNMLETGTGIVGNVAGMLLPISWLTKAYTLGLGGAARLTKQGGAAKALGLTSESTAGVSTMIKAPSIGRSEMRRIMFNNLAANTAALATHMQMSPHAIDNRLSTFFESLAYGIGIPLGLKGVGLVAGRAGVSMQDMRIRLPAEVASVGASAAAISIMFDPEHPADALVNAGVMAALHGVMAPIARGKALKAAERQYAADRQLFQKALKEEGARMANNILYTYMPKRLSWLRAEDPIPVLKSDEVAAIRTEAMRKLDKLHASGVLSPEDYIKERTTIFAASSMLEKPALSPKASYDQDVLDLLSIAQQSARMKNDAISPPADLGKMVGTLDDRLLQNSLVNSSSAQTPSGRYPSGEIRLSGMAKEQNPYQEFIQLYFEKLGKGQASPTILLVDRPELAPLWRSMNTGMSAADISGRVSAPFQNPSNAVQAYGIVYTPQGGRQMVPLGWLPRRFHIDKEGSIHSFNNQYESLFQRYKDKPDAYRIPDHDVNMNKDAVSEAMKRHGLQFMVANVHQTRRGSQAKLSKQPWMHLTLNDENWAKSIELNNLFRGRTAGASTRTVPTAVAQVNSALNAKVKQAQIKEIRQNVKDPAGDLLSSPEAAVLQRQAAGETAAVQSLLGNARESLLQPTPQAMAAKLKQYFGMDIPEKTTVEIFNNRNDMTVRQLFGYISKHGDDSLKRVLSEFINPFVESPLFRRDWSYGKTFPELRVLGGLRPVQEGTIAPATRKTAIVDAGQAKQQTAQAGQQPVPKTDAQMSLFEQPQQAARSTQRPEATATPRAQPPAGQAAPPAATGAPVAGTAPAQQTPLAQRIAAQARGMPVAGQARGVSVSTAPAQRPRAAPVAGAAAAPAAQSASRVAGPQAPVAGANVAPVAQAAPGPAGPQAARRYPESITKGFSDSARELELRGNELMEARMVPDRRSQYVKELSAIIKSIDPIGGIPDPKARGGFRDYNPSEKRAIRERVIPRMRMRAQELVEDAFNIDNEIAFKTGSIESGELHTTMRTLVKADTMRGLGDLENASQLLRRLPEDEAKRAMDILDMKGLESLLKPIAPRAKKQPPTKEEYDELLTVQRKTQEATGKQQADAIEAGRTSDDPYFYARSIGLDTFFKQGELNLKSKDDLRLLGIPFTPFGVSKRAGIFKKSDLTELSTGADRPGMRTTQTKEFIEERGKMESALEGRKIREPRTPKEGEEIERVEDVAPLWQKLYPALNAAIVGGRQPTAADGIRDAYAYFWHVAKEAKRFGEISKEPVKNLSFGFLKKGKLPRELYGKPDSERYAYNREQTQKLLRDILNRVEADLAKRGGGD